MIVYVFVKPGSKREGIAWDGRQLVVAVKDSPRRGAANERLLVVLAEWLHIAKGRVRVIKGWTSRHKTLDIGVDPAVFNKQLAAVERLPRQERLL